MTVQSDRGVNIPTPALGNTAKVTRLFRKSLAARDYELTRQLLIDELVMAASFPSENARIL